jgi:SAM-dependent methyltransferase
MGQAQGTSTTEAGAGGQPPSRLGSLKHGARRQLERFIDPGPDSGFDVLRSRVARLRGRGKLQEAGPEGTVPVRFFDDLYASKADPWSYGESFRDERRHALMLGALPRPRFRSAYEPACAVGHLSARLAERCDSLLCSDVAAEAVAQARTHLAGYDNVTVEQHYLPADVPDGHFDLVVLSDLCVYLTPDKLDELLDRLLPHLEVGGILLVNDGRWLSGPIVQSGDDVYQRVRRRPELRKQAGYRDFSIRISVFERRAS